MRLLTILIALTFVFPSLAVGQEHYILSRFLATKDKSRVILTWSIKQNHSCIGIGILRSTIGGEFEQIGEIQGICGSTREEQHFTFVDENPIPNTNNYYVLELGFSGKTEPPIAVEFINFENQTSKVIPNPFLLFTKIHFFNPNNEKFDLSIYDSLGKFVTSYKSNTDEFIVSLDNMQGTTKFTLNFPQNKYYYIITDQNNKKVSSGVLLTITQ